MAVIAKIKLAQANGQVVNTYNDGACFSMAAIILQCGNTRFVADNSLTMLHAPSVDTSGDANRLRKDADTLDKVGDELSERHLGQGREQVED